MRELDHTGIKLIGVGVYNRVFYLTRDEFNEDQNDAVFNNTVGRNIDDSVSSENFVGTNFSESSDKHIVYKGLPEKQKQKKQKKVKESGELCRST